jgi:hypothetical protein
MQLDMRDERGAVHAPGASIAREICVPDRNAIAFKRIVECTTLEETSRVVGMSRERLQSWE